MTTTGLKEINFTPKRILGVTDWRDYFFQKMLAEVRAVAAKTFAAPGVFETQIDISADGNDKFKLAPFSDATDGIGHLFTPDAELGEGVQFANALGVDYSVGLHFAQRPRGYARNPRTGYPDILSLEDTIGNQSTPDSVIDDGDGTMTITVDSVCEASVSHAGRQCVVWKLSPGINATSEAEIIETLTVVWNGVNNKVSTTGNFGQGATASVVEADYAVTLIGPSVRKNTDLSLEPEYAFIGVVTGVGAGSPPSVFDMTGQNVIDSTLSDFNEITRIDSHGKMKISVQGDASDSGENQIEVKSFAGATKFSVDEAGNVVIAGDLLVQGDEIVQNTETINTTLVVGAQAQLGDADTDSHIVKGTWTHKFGGSTTAFEIDGVTGNATFEELLTVNGAATFTAGLTVNNSSNLVLSNTASLLKHINDASTSAPDPTTNKGFFLDNADHTANSLSPPIFFQNARTASGKDAIAMFSKRIADNDVDLHFALYKNDAFDSDVFSFDMSAGFFKVPTRTLSASLPIVPAVAGSASTNAAFGTAQSGGGINNIVWSAVTGALDDDSALITIPIGYLPPKAQITSVTLFCDVITADGANTKVKASIATDVQSAGPVIDASTTGETTIGASTTDKVLLVTFAAPYAVPVATGHLFLALGLKHTGGGTSTGTINFHDVRLTYTIADV